MILVILLSLVLVAIVFDILRVHAFKTKCFRIKDSTTGQLSSAPEVSSDDRCETTGVMMQAPESLAQG